MELYHYGIKRRSGRYPYGSGARPHQHTGKKIKLSDSQKQTIKTVAFVGAGLAITYGAHKLINNPKAIEVGKKVINAAVSNNSGIKNAVQSSTEYKIAKKVGKGGKKVLETVGSDKVGRTISGIGGMAGTAILLRTQIDDVKKIKTGDGDTLDKTLATISKTSDIGVSINTLAKGPKGNSKFSSGSYSGSTNPLLKKTRDLKSVVGEPKGMSGADDERRYSELFKRLDGKDDERRGFIKAMRKNGYSVDQIESYVFHSDLFTTMVLSTTVQSLCHNGMKWVDAYVAI